MTLVGRDIELEAVSRAIDGARAGGFHAVVISGEPGIGKTTVLAAGAALARGSALTVLRARAVTQERDVPFALATSLLDDHAAAATPETLRGHGEELSAVLPSVPSPGAAPTAPSTAAERFRYHRALRALLDDVADGRPFLLAVDDLQWADEGSFEWLLHLLRRPPRSPAALVLAARPGPAALELVAAAREDGEHLQLAPLGREASLAVLDTLGDRALAERLAGEAGGNPLFLRELGRAVARGTAELPATIAAAIQHEVADLDEGARELLAAAAVAGDPFDDDVVATAAGVVPAAAGEALDALVRADIVRPGEAGRSFAFRHPLVRRAVYDGLEAGRRLALHAALALELGRRGAPPLVRAPHVERSATAGDAAAVALLTAAAEEAADTAPAVAAGLWASALGLLGAAAPQRRRGILAARARALAAAGHPAAALEAFDGAEALGHDAQTAALAAQLERELGSAAAARARLVAALEHAVGGDRALLELELGTTAFAMGDVEAARIHARRAVEAWPQDSAGARAVQGALDVFVGVLAGEASPDDLEPFEGAALALPERDVQDAAGLIGSLSFQGERYRAAARLLDRAIASGRVRRADSVLASRRILRAICLYFDLRLDGALEEAEAAEEGARLQGSRLHAGWAGSTRAIALDLMGRGTEAEAAAETSLADMADLEPAIVVSSATALSLSIVHVHDPERLIAEVLGRIGPMLVRVSSLLRPLVAAAVATGRTSEAARWLDEVELWTERSTMRAGRVRVAVARAELLLAAGAPEAARPLADTAVSGADAAVLPLDTVWALITQGRVLAAAGERGAALTAFERGLAAAAQAGAGGPAGEAARELRAAGLRMTARGMRAFTAQTGAELTPREHAIAELVARGRSNKEVAGVLFLSVKTVENNLSRIYAKLGVRSRAELARAMPGAAQGGGGGSPSSGRR